MFFGPCFQRLSRPLSKKLLRIRSSKRCPVTSITLGTVGTTVKLTTVGAPTPQISETTVTRAEAPKVLEYNWGGSDIRWELEALGDGTRLRLWHNIDRRFISMGAAGWHISFDVLDRLLSGTPIGRIVGGDAMKFGWQRLNAEYAKHFGIETPKWPSQAAQKGESSTN